MKTKHLSGVLAGVLIASMGLTAWSQEDAAADLEKAKQALAGYDLQKQLGGCEAFKQKAQEFRNKVVEIKTKIDEQKTASVQEVVNLLDNKLSMTDSSSAYNICRHDRLLTQTILRANYFEARLKALESQGDSSSSKSSKRSKRRRRR